MLANRTRSVGLSSGSIITQNSLKKIMPLPQTFWFKVDSTSLLSKRRSFKVFFKKIQFRNIFGLFGATKNSKISEMSHDREYIITKSNSA